MRLKFEQDFILGIGNQELREHTEYFSHLHICKFHTSILIIMKVFKFGGASINSTARIQNVAKIIESFKGEKVLVIISAMGKMTNALEKVAEEFFSGHKEQALALFQELKAEHIAVSTQLTGGPIPQFSDLFTEVEWLLHDRPVRDFDYYYDQIVCIGELLSTVIVSNYFNQLNIKNQWIDVRDIVRTDDNFRDATIDWRNIACIHQYRYYYYSGLHWFHR